MCQLKLSEITRQAVTLIDIAALFNEITDLIHQLENLATNKPKQMISNESWQKQFLKFANALPAYGVISSLHLSNALQSVSGNVRSVFLYQLIERLKERYHQVIKLTGADLKRIRETKMTESFYLVLPLDYTNRLTLLVQTELPYALVSLGDVSEPDTFFASKLPQELQL